MLGPAARLTSVLCEMGFGETVCFAEHVLLLTGILRSALFAKQVLRNVFFLELGFRNKKYATLVLVSFDSFRISTEFEILYDYHRTWT